METLKVITVVIITVAAISAIAGGAAWVFVHAYLAKHEAKRLHKEPSIKAPNSFDTEELLELEEDKVDYSQVKYFGKPITELSRDMLLQAIYHSAKSCEIIADRCHKLELQNADLAFKEVIVHKRQAEFDSRMY